MKIDRRRIAPLGLYLSLVAALAAAGLYIVQRQWNLPLQISLGLVVVGLAIFAILDPEQVRSALTGRQARYGSNALVMTLAFVGIIIVINYLVFKNPGRWDLTETKQYTLANETLDTLKSLPGAVKAEAFFTRRMSRDEAEALLEQYKLRGGGKFDYEFIDPDANPVAAQQAEIETDGTIVLGLGDKREKVINLNEREMTGALVRLLSTRKPTLYFLTGHGEYSPEAAGDRSYSQAKSDLENKNYVVKALNLVSAGSIPQDAEAIVIAGPLKPLLKQEVDQLAQYLEGGGSLIVMEEPVLLTEFGDQPDLLAEYLDTKWGILLGQDMIVDLNVDPWYWAVSEQYGSHPITDKLQGGAIFPTTRSVKTSNASGLAILTELVLTGQNSWAETDQEQLVQSAQNDQLPEANQDIDLMGPVPIVVTGEETTTGARLVIFGDADFAADANYVQLANGDLLVNSLDWATEQENLINLTPKQEVQRFFVPPARYTLNLLLLGSVFILPGIVLLAGVVVWAQRRRRG